ncbi:MAG: type II secretion system protein [Gammaproteobacteria bacterium]|nr:type II secretion system protein [Gammaproteobacteria bacterium]
MNLIRKIQLCRGFTLIELIIVIAIMSVAALPILGMFIESAKTIETNLDIQTATRLAEECGELILAQKRNEQVVYGYANIDTDCTALTYPYNGFSAPTVTITDPFSGSGCPATASCKLIQVDAIKNSVTLSSITFMLADSQ